MPQLFQSIPGERSIFLTNGRFQQREIAAKFPGVIFVHENKLEAPHQKRLKLRQPNPEPFEVAVHDVGLEIFGRRTEFLDGCPDWYVPLQFRCDFDRRRTAAPAS